ncbi:hypothetical protein [Clostridium sp. UBA6640]|nr:hypothetical protein [Clostridium sp. UBA6640]
MEKENNKRLTVNLKEYVIQVAEEMAVPVRYNLGKFTGILMGDLRL